MAFERRCGRRAASPAGAVRAAGVVVDTHVARLSLRMGLTPPQTTKTLNTDKIERDLMALDQLTPCVRIAPLIFHHHHQRAARAQYAKNVVNR